jgi:hypothetical protein
MTITDTMSAADMAALEKSLAIALRDPARREQVEGMLATNDRLQVARFCCYGCQYISLDLKPWQIPPCWAKEDSGTEAGELLRRMIEAGVSKYDPDPVGALERSR